MEPGSALADKSPSFRKFTALVTQCGVIVACQRLICSGVAASERNAASTMLSAKAAQ